MSWRLGQNLLLCPGCENGRDSMSFSSQGLLALRGQVIRFPLWEHACVDTQDHLGTVLGVLKSLQETQCHYVQLGCSLNGL